MIEASFPEWSSILVIGSPGIGILEFNLTLAKKHLDDGVPVVLVTTDMRCKDLLSTMENFGIDYNEMLGDKLFIIDYHSSLLGSSKGEDESAHPEILNVVDLEGIMFNVDSISKKIETPMKIYVHSLSTLFLYSDPKVVLKFFQISSSRIRSDFGSAMFNIHDGVHDQRFINHLMAMADGVVELKFDDDLEKRMRIRHMRGTTTSSKWIPYKITKGRSSTSKPLLEWK